jgi:release factor glutamine methyltransferase
MVLNSKRYKFAAMLAKDSYRNFLVQLQKIYPLSEASVMVDWVFEHMAHIKKNDLIKNSSLQLEPKVDKKINEQLKELLSYKPIQYVLGEAWFYNLRFVVNEHTLIPRPETEELVHLVLDQLKTAKFDKNNKISFNTANPATVSILDIGTGSGCIPIVLKKNLPLANITSIDISEDAIKTAIENATTHHVDINFKVVDFLDESGWSNMPMYDIIVSNPPYIPIAEKEKLNRNVTAFEPHTALFVPNENPFLFYEKIARFAKDHVNYGGKVFVECHEDYAKDTALVFGRNCSHTQIIKDVFGKERMMIAYY